LEAPVEETDERGWTQRTTRNKDDGRGTPQGGVISPLLANLYMRRFVLGWKTLGHERRLNAHIVNYADDFVICCPRGCAAEAMRCMREMMTTLRLTVNEAKTRLCKLPGVAFDFLGYTFGRLFSRRNGREYVGPKPSKKSLGRVCDEIRVVTQRSTTWKTVHEVVGQLNRLLRGWTNYFSRGTVVHAYGTVMQKARHRLRRWLCVKHKVRWGGYGRYPNRHLHERLGLFLPRGCTYS
jgi:RNA-directed DNA polymerase